MPAANYTLSIGSVYDFHFYATGLLGVGLSKAKVAALLDFSSAIMITDVSAIHAQVLPQLPNGTPADPAKLVYVKLVSNTGAVSVVAMDWITMQPVSVDATSVNLTVNINSLSDISLLTACLNAGGFTSFSIN